MSDLPSVLLRGSELKQISPYRVLRSFLMAGAATCFLALGSLTEAQPLRSPVRLSLAPNGSVLVSDYREQKIFTLDPERLQPVRAFAIMGRPLATVWGRGSMLGTNRRAASKSITLPGSGYTTSTGSAAPT